MRELQAVRSSRDADAGVLQPMLVRLRIAVVSVPSSR
jgi:hypothetical protein